MALELNMARTAIDKLGEKMYISDTTGDYHVDDNPGGYGAPNPERNSLALLSYARLVGTELDTAVTVDPYDPLTVENFTLTCEADGYYEFIVVAVQNVDPTVEGEYGYSAENGLTQLIDSVVTSVTVLDVYEDEAFLNDVSFKTVLLARISILRNTTNLSLIKLQISNEDDRGHKRQISDKQREFDSIESRLTGANYHWCLDNYMEAQRIVETFNVSEDE